MCVKLFIYVVNFDNKMFKQTTRLSMLARVLAAQLL